MVGWPERSSWNFMFFFPFEEKALKQCSFKITCQLSGGEAVEVSEPVTAGRRASPKYSRTDGQVENNQQPLELNDSRVRPAILAPAIQLVWNIGSRLVIWKLTKESPFYNCRTICSFLSLVAIHSFVNGALWNWFWLKYVKLPNLFGEIPLTRDTKSLKLCGK